MLHRVFLAINLPTEIKVELAKIIEKLQSENRRANIKWVEPENLHLTLHFLGSLDDDQIQRVIEGARKIISKYNGFEMSLGAISCFPNPYQPRVIFVEAREGGGVARKIHSDLKSMLTQLKIETDYHSWQSHITLGRVKTPTACHGLNQQIQPLKSQVKSIELMESKLQPSGPEYSIIHSFPLLASSY